MIIMFSGKSLWLSEIYYTFCQLQFKIVLAVNYKSLKYLSLSLVKAYAKEVFSLSIFYLSNEVWNAYESADFLFVVRVGLKSWMQGIHVFTLGHFA